MEPKEFARLSETYIDAMKAAFMLGRVITYDGRIADTDCIVMAATSDPNDPLKETKPLAILCTPEVFEKLQVEATRVREDGTEIDDGS